MIERARWRIVELVDKLPGQCWTDLVMWAIDGPQECRRRGGNPLPWRPVTNSCRAFSPPNDRCYCGKICGRAETEVAS